MDAGREQHAGAREREERERVCEQRELRAAAGGEQPAEQRAEHEAGVARGLDLPVDLRQLALVRERGHERELGGVRDGVDAAEQRGEHEQRGERVGERERDAQRGGEQRAADQHLRGRAPVGEHPGRPGEHGGRAPERDEQRRDGDPGLAALLHVQRERHDREPVAEGGQADRADQQAEVAAVASPNADASRARFYSGSTTSSIISESCQPRPSASRSARRMTPTGVKPALE